MGVETYANAREFFQAARDAARDAECIRRQLERMSADAAAIGGGGFEPRVRSTPDPDAIGRKMVALVDQGDHLRERQAEDYRLINSALEVLYGPDNRSGLYALVGWPADAIYHHYLALRKWREVASMIGYSERHTLDMVRTALDMADSIGDFRTRMGVGLDET